MQSLAPSVNVWLQGHLLVLPGHPRTLGFLILLLALESFNFSSGWSGRPSSPVLFVPEFTPKAQHSWAFIGLCVCTWVPQNRRNLDPIVGCFHCLGKGGKDWSPSIRKHQLSASLCVFNHNLEKAFTTEKDLSLGCELLCRDSTISQEGVSAFPRGHSTQIQKEQNRHRKTTHFQSTYLNKLLKTTSRSTPTHSCIGQVRLWQFIAFLWWCREFLCCWPLCLQKRGTKSLGSLSLRTNENTFPNCSTFY